MAIGLHGDKTMFTNANVRPANDAVWSATGPTRALTEGNGAGETYRRPHAPRSGKPKNAPLTGLHFEISSTSELRTSATRRFRVSECARPSPRLLDRSRASYRRRNWYSPTDQVSQIRPPIWSRGRTAHSIDPPMGWSVDSYGRHQPGRGIGPAADRNGGSENSQNARGKLSG